jgi:hypothetical protein
MYLFVRGSQFGCVRLYMFVLQSTYYAWILIRADECVHED